MTQKLSQEELVEALKLCLQSADSSIPFKSKDCNTNVPGALHRIGTMLGYLGYFGPDNSMGALEGHTVKMSEATVEGANDIATSIRQAGEAIKEGLIEVSKSLDVIAEAID